MTVNLGTTRIINVDTSQGGAGLPRVVAPTAYERNVGRIPDLTFWVSAGNAPSDMSPFLRDRRAGYAMNKTAEDETTVLGTAAPGGLPSIEFDDTAGGKQGVLAAGFQMPSDQYTIVAVVRLDNPTEATIAAGSEIITNRFNFEFLDAGRLRLDHGATAADAVTWPGVIADDGSEWAIVWGSYSSAAGTAALGKNTEDPLHTDTIAAPHQQGPGLMLGAYASANRGPFAMAELFVIERASHIETDTQGVSNLSALLAMLRARYSIS